MVINKRLWRAIDSINDARYKLDKRIRDLHTEKASRHQLHITDVFLKKMIGEVHDKVDDLVEKVDALYDAFDLEYKSFPEEKKVVKKDEDPDSV